MLNGIVKAAVIIAVAALVDQFLTGGTFTDGALSMLRQMEHSFH